MFMFAFAVLFIAIIGLFLQIVGALSLFLAAQMHGVGGQLLIWQNIAIEYACTPPLDVATGTFSTTAGTIAYSDVTNLRPNYQGFDWETVVFDGIYGTHPSRLVLTYINPGSSYGGYSAAQVAQQFHKQFRSNDYRFSPVRDDGGVRAIDVTVSDDGVSYIVTVSGIPAGGGDAVPLNASGIISPVQCTP